LIIVVVLLLIWGGINASCCYSDSFLVASIELLIFHFLGFCIILPGIFSVLSCLLYLSLNLHLLLLCHSLLGCKMLKFIIIVGWSCLMRNTSFSLMNIGDFLHWLDNWGIFNIYSVLVAHSHTSRIYELNHFLSHYWCLKDLRH
jgi:hypothetical protein